MRKLTCERLSVFLFQIHSPNGAGKTTLFKLLCGDLNPSKGQIKKNPHLKISRFTQHFEEKLDLSMTPLDFFKQKLMPKEPIEKIRALLGRYGCSGDMQSQVMDQLSAGQKARIVFAIICWEKPHLLLLDERKYLSLECDFEKVENHRVRISHIRHCFSLFSSSATNPLDMESIDALARCLQKFQGGVVVISHDMRLVSQVAEEIYICDKKQVTKYKGDIMDFKMHTQKENSKRLAQHQNG